MGWLRRSWDFLLSAGEYEGENRLQRGRRRIVVGILWFSVLGLAAGPLGDSQGWATVMDWTKAAAHLAALLALWVWPRRITLIIFTMLLVDLYADATITLLYGGFYEAGLQILWSLIGVLALLVISTVRVAAVFFILYLVTLIAVASISVEPNYVLEAPEEEAVQAVVFVALFIFLGFFYFVRQRDQFQQESDDLLHSILPDEIATRLKLGDGELIADHYDEVSVMFLDVVDFTPMSSDMTPAELVGLLDEIFTDIDSFVDETGLEKIKTVGDEYMVASGVPTPRSDHAESMADLALRIQERLACHDYAGHQIVARIGINSGPVVAGVIGKRKFSYDLWGDVVNTASRMESHGEPGRIQVSQSTYEHLQGLFECEPRGAIDVKGKGDLETWFLVRRLHDSRNVEVPSAKETGGQGLTGLPSTKQGGPKE